MPASRTIEWSRLSPAGMEVVRQIGFRVTAGYNYDEIAIMVEAQRGDLRHVELPKGPISKTWVIARMRDLRQEIDATHPDLATD